MDQYSEHSVKYGIYCLKPLMLNYVHVTAYNDLIISCVQWLHRYC